MLTHSDSDDKEVRQKPLGPQTLALSFFFLTTCVETPVGEISLWSDLS